MDNNFSIRKLKSADAERMLEWMHDDDITKHLRLNGRNATKDDVLLFIENAKDESINLHRAVVNQSDDYLGTISLKNIDQEKKEAEYAIAMHPVALGTGAAFVASEQILKVAFEQLGLQRVYLNVLEENERAVRFYTKLSALGFKLEKQTTMEFHGTEKKLLWYATTR